MDYQLPVAVVCRVLGVPRSSVYARRARAGASGWSGPATSISDTDLVKLIRQVLAASPFAGEGYRKVRARLRREHGLQVSGKRVLRLLRQEGLLAPQRVRGRRRPRPRDGTIIPDGRTSGGAPMPPCLDPGRRVGVGLRLHRSLQR
jgi:putative transposase